jgi:hypothetical protein
MMNYWKAYENTRKKWNSWLSLVVHTNAQPKNILYGNFRKIGGSLGHM